MYMLTLMYVVVGCSSTHNKLGLACSLFIITHYSTQDKKRTQKKKEAHAGSSFAAGSLIYLGGGGGTPPFCPDFWRWRGK